MENKEFLEKLEELGFTPELYHGEEIAVELFDYKYDDDLGWEEENKKINELITNFFNSHGLGMYKEVEQFGGEGQGDEYYVVLYFPEVNKYIRADAYYSSYNGVSDWESWYIVSPKTKTITVYEADEEETTD